MKKTAFGGMLALLGALAAAPPAQAANTTLCTDTIFTDDKALNPGWQSCFRLAGVFDSSLADVAAVNAFYRLHTFQRTGLSSDGSAGSPFASILNPVLDLSGSLVAGQLELVIPQSDYFVIGLQATDLTTKTEKILFYQFDYTGLAAAKTIYFDTLGFDRTLATLESAALYLPLLAVPEPAGWTTTLLSLGLLVTVGRRRHG